MISKEQLNRLYRYAVSLCLDRDHAYDLVQNSLARYLEPPVSDIDDPVPYLFTSIRNGYIDQYRQRQRHTTVELTEEYGEASDYDIRVLETVMVNERQAEYLMDFLDDQEREILFLWGVEGYSTQEVADLIDMPKGTVLSRIHRLRQRMFQHKARENNCGVCL